MSYKTTTAALLLALVSTVVALRVDTGSPGGIDADLEIYAELSNASASIRQGSPVAVEAPTTTVIYADSAEHQRTIEWALARYAAAGLELPAIEITAHEDRAGCGDKNGYFSATEGGEYRIHWCGNDFTILHELAHAWAAATLDDETKAALLAIADADEWISDDWHRCGSEHSANVIAWGLMDTRINQTRTRPYDHNSMLQAYAALTDGGQPLWMSS